MQSFSLWLENLNPKNLYHGSRKEFPNGFILTPQNDGYTSYPEVQFSENILELVRPKDKLSRKKSVYMVADIDEIDSAGGYLDFVYLVRPLGRVEASDEGWYSEIDEWIDNPDQAKECAINYWNGTPYKGVGSLFEYRTPKAMVLRLVHSE
jgi:hypothetical protein